MRSLLVLALVFLGFSSFVRLGSSSQFLVLDNGHGTPTSKKIALLALQYLQENNFVKLKSLFQKGTQVDSSLLKKNCKYVSSKYPLSKIPISVPFVERPGKEENEYKRTFYRMKGNKPVFLFQVYMVISDGFAGCFITDIQFRKGGKIEKVETDLSNNMQKENSR